MNDRPKMNEDTLFLKIIVVGDSGVGKTCLLNRFCYDKFEANTAPTVGCDFCTKVITDFKGKTLRMQLWDVAGQERFKNLSKMYIRGALGCIVVSDLMKPETMESGALDWKNLIETQADPLIDGKTIPIVLFGNKVDLIENKTLVSDQTQNLKNFVKKNGFDGGFLTSAKENVNLQEAFTFLTQIIVTRHLSKTDLDNQGGFDSGNNRAVSLKNAQNPENNIAQSGSKSGCC